MPGIRNVVFTQDGGFAGVYTAGQALARGDVVKADTGSREATKTTASTDSPLGIVVADATSGAEVAVAVAGVAFVNFQSGSTAAGDTAFVGSTAGRGHTSGLKVIGHCLDSGTAASGLKRVSLTVGAIHPTLFNNLLSGLGVLVQATTGATITTENPLSVARGGTGAATLPSHQILYGSGTSAISSSTSLIFNPTNGYLSLNISEVNTQSRIHAFGSSAATSSLLLERASADAFGAYTYHLKSRLAYKSATVVNDYSGGPIFSIYNSANVWKDVAAIWGQTTNVTSGTEAGDIVFFCATDGAIADADERMRITSAGSLSLVGASPTARLHLPAGTATASTAPLKLATGTALAAAEDGAMEYDTSHLWFTIGATR